MPPKNAPNMFALSRFSMDVVRRQNRKKVKALNAFETLRAFMILCSGGEGESNKKSIALQIVYAIMKSVNFVTHKDTLTLLPPPPAHW